LAIDGKRRLEMSSRAIKKVNCRACGRTHYGLWSHDDGVTVECPFEHVAVSTATGQPVKTVEPEQVVEHVAQEPEPEPKPVIEPKKKPAKKATSRKAK
jgi:hypothetical protein